MPSCALRCAGFMALYYGTNAVYQGYISKFYQQLGVSGVPLILLLVSFPLISILSQPLWGRLADRLPRPNAALLAVIGLSIPALCGLGMVSGTMPLLLLACIFALFYPSIQPLGDSLILQALKDSAIPYGRVRLCGSAAYALCSLLAGWLLKDQFRAVPWITAGMLTVLFFSTFLLPVPRKARPARQRGAFLQIFHLPHVLPLLGLLSLLQLTMGYFYSYYPLHFTALSGGTAHGLGWAYFLGSVSELPFLLCGDRLFDRFGAGRLMLLSAGALCVRFALLALCASPAAAIASQMLHGLGFVVMMLSMAKYMSRIAPPALRASSQAVISMAGFGLSRTFGVLAGGLVSQWSGSIARGFALMSLLCAVALLCFAPFFLRLPPLNGKDC